MGRLRTGVVVALILQVAVLPAGPGLAEDRLPGRGQEEAPADQPTRRPAEDPGTAAPTPTGEDTGAPPQAELSPEAPASAEEGPNGPFGADPAEATSIDTGVGVTAALWVLAVLAASGICWAGVRRSRR